MKKIIIIGAGPAGITAGVELLRKSKEYQVTILEETEKMGGISRTVEYHGNRMDIGGHRFFSKDKEVTNWWEKMMPTQGAASLDDKLLHREMSLQVGGPDPDKTDRVMLLRNRVSRIYYRKKFFDYPVKMNWTTIKNMGFIVTMQAGFSYLKSIVVKKPEDSLENFYINRFGKKLYSMFFEGYTEKLWGRHPREIAADWGAQRVKGLSIMAILGDVIKKTFHIGNKDKVETSLIEEFKYPKYGPGQLWETAADEFQKLGGTLVTGAKVVSVLSKEENGSKEVTGVTIEKQNGQDAQNGIKVTQEQMDADIVISSMPLQDLVAGMKEVPENINEIAAGLPYRDFVTVGLLLPKLNLKNETKIRTINNQVPDCWIYVQDTGVKLGRIQIFNNWSPYLVKNPEKTVWIGLEYFCREGDSYWNMNKEQWTNLGIQELLKMGVISDASEVMDSHMERVKKAYPAYFDTYAQIGELRDYLNTYPNLYCVGRNGQHRYNNMDHSMATSFETVRNILSGKQDKTNIWNVNTEKEYHEKA